MRTPPSERVLRFDAFTLDLSRCALLRDDVEIPLRRQAFDMLRYLAEHRGRLVSKDELTKAIWRRAGVSDDSLVKCVRDIRDALCDRDHRIVQTVHGRGYLLAPDAAATDAGSHTETTKPIAPPSLRTHSLLNAVRQHVPSVGRRAAAALATALVVVAGLSAWALRTPPVAPSAAHHAILARAILDKERSPKSNQEALALFGKALAIDPDSTPALLGYARVMVVDVGEGWVPPHERPARLDQAKAAVERAIRLEPANAGAYQLLGNVLRLRGEVDAALAALERALALNPDMSWTYAEMGRTKIELGRAEEALSDIETALRMSPSELALEVWYRWAGMAALHAGRSEEAARWLQKALRVRPGDRFPVPMLAVAYAETGRENEGRVLMAEYLRQRPGLTIESVKRDFPARNPTIAKQRERIIGVLRRLGVPEGAVRTGSVR